MKLVAVAVAAIMALGFAARSGDPTGAAGQKFDQALDQAANAAGDAAGDAAGQAAGGAIDSIDPVDIAKVAGGIAVAKGGIEVSKGVGAGVRDRIRGVKGVAPRGSRTPAAQTPPSAQPVTPTPPPPTPTPTSRPAPQVVTGTPTQPDANTRDHIDQRFDGLFDAAPSAEHTDRPPATQQCATTPAGIIATLNCTEPR